MTHSVLTASRVLENIPDIDFVRIDGDKNDLAWYLENAARLQCNFDRFLILQAIHDVRVPVAAHLSCNCKVGKSKISIENVDKRNERSRLCAGKPQSVASITGTRDGMQLQGEFNVKFSFISFLFAILFYFYSVKTQQTIA